jgi:hypothetical protein
MLLVVESRNNPVDVCDLIAHRSSMPWPRPTASWCINQQLAPQEPVPSSLLHSSLQSPSFGIETKIGNHSLRATGVTDYLKSGGTLEKAQAMANHSSPRTTKLYDRRSDEASLDEYEKVGI